MKNIIITGSNGLVATELIHLLLEDGCYRIFAVTTNISKLSERYAEQKNVVCTTLSDLCTVVNGAEIDAVLHCAFARSADGEDIARSLDFTQTIARIAKEVKTKLFVNISSQSVYGKKRPPLWTEETPTAPDYLYAVGKFATEVIVDSILADSETKYTNIRLASVCENARFMNVFVKNALSEKPIHIQGGSQVCSFIDVRDVANALKRVIDNGLKINLEKAYNLGVGENATIVELANIVRDCSIELFGRDVTIEIEPADIKMEVGMDNALFCKAFDWKPAYSYKDMVLSLYALNIKELSGGGKMMPYAFTVCYR